MALAWGDGVWGSSTWGGLPVVYNVSVDESISTANTWGEGAWGDLSWGGLGSISDSQTVQATFAFATSSFATTSTYYRCSLTATSTLTLTTTSNLAGTGVQIL